MLIVADWLKEKVSLLAFSCALSAHLLAICAGANRNASDARPAAGDWRCRAAANCRVHLDVVLKLIRAVVVAYAVDFAAPR